LQEDPKRITTALEEDGCVILKGLIILDICQEAINQYYKQRGNERYRSEHGALGVNSIIKGIIKKVTLNKILRPFSLSDIKLMSNF